MSLDIPSWNIVEFVIICFYSCYLSFIYAPEGGLTVVAVYVPLVLLGVPAVFVQLKLGGYLQRGLVGVFSLFFPFWKGVGIAALFDLLLQLSTLAPLVAQLGTYAFIAISKEDYIWGNCENMNYQETCDPQGVSMSRPANIFYKQAFLQVSSDIQNINGFPQWQFTDLARKAGISLMPVTLAIVWVLVTLFVGFGARVCGWILFLLAPAAISCLLTVLGYGYHHLNNTHTVDYLKTLYMFHESEGDVLEKWLKGFKLLIYTFPMWTPICCTMGKFCGKSQRIRNMTWIALVAVFVLVSQLPNLAMAPYLGNLLNSGQHFSIASDISRIMIQMPEAFTAFKIPHAYGFVFYLSAFLLTLMFLCMGTLTIVDNIVESLRHWIDKHTCSKIAVHLLITFLVMLVAMGLGIIQTTKAGHYYYLLFTQSFDKLRFLIIILIAFGLMIVYVKQNFGLIERIVMGFWFTISALISSCCSQGVTLLSLASTLLLSGLWLYHLYIQLDLHWTNIKLDDITISKEEPNYLPQEWTWVSWAIAGFPFIGILLGAIHACFSACKDSSQKCRKLCCGMTERIREQNGDDFSPPPLHPSEPSAPPYMYSYIDRSMNGTHRHEDYDLDHYKLDYDPPETEPLTRNNRSTRI